MATQEVLQVYGDSFLFADVTDFPNAGAGPPETAANDLRVGTGTKVQIDLTLLAAAAGRQSAKLALPAAWAEKFVLGACIEHEAAPDAGGTVEFWWAASPNSTAGTGNPTGVSGADDAYTVAYKTQLIFIGSLTVIAATINRDPAVGVLWPPHRYGSLIVINSTSSKFLETATAMDNTHIVLASVIPDLQAAA